MATDITRDRWGIPVLPIYRILLPLLLCLSIQASATPVTDFPEGTRGLLFRVAGSNTVGAHLMRNFLKGYFLAKGAEDIRVLPLQTENEYRVEGLVSGLPVYVEVAAHGSSTGFKALLAGDTDVGMSSRPIKDKEAVALAAGGDMLSTEGEHVIAIDGLAIIVHKDNPLQALSLEQLAGVFSGDVRNWRELGGLDRPINLYARDDKSGTWDTFKNLVLRKRVKLSIRAERFESNDQLSDQVSTDVWGIGFVGLASVRNSRALLVSDAGTKPLLPEQTTVATEDYVLSRRLYLYTQPQAVVSFLREFIGFTQTDMGQQQVGRTGFISQALISTPADEHREGPAAYLALTKDAQRLSVNFRFSHGSAVLDNKAQRDIQRVVDYVSREENRDKTIYLIGFGDAKQSESRSHVLSKLRALTVRSALHKKKISSAPIAGFGAYMPVAADSALGKVKNRRVEVWVR